jgi:hypothetical protein
VASAETRLTLLAVDFMQPSFDWGFLDNRKFLNTFTNLSLERYIQA